MIENIVTIEESDTFNALSPEWESLTAVQTNAHIYNATLYIHSSWLCTEIDWTDLASVDGDVKRACSFYADADRIGVLFDPIEKTDAHRTKTMEKKKLGTMEKTIQWAQGGTIVSGNPLQSIDAIMRLYCSNATETTVLRN